MPPAKPRIPPQIAHHCAERQSLLRLRGHLPHVLEIEHPARLRDVELRGDVAIAGYSYVGAQSEISNAKIGRFCSIARRVVIGTDEHPVTHLTTHPLSFGGGDGFAKDPYFAATRSRVPSPRGPITQIGHDVWIGDGAFIRAGVSIGTGAIIGARAVVTRDVAPYEVVAGLPARPLRKRFSPEMITRLLQSRWWQLDLRALDLDLADPASCLDQIDAAGDNLVPLSLQSDRIERRPGVGIFLNGAPLET
ncbi:CatB-related O-acetyltransferase [Celeribacter sp. HF31]|nr:CatB-related O-acetyltransferase [Celeribacter sp. HF31]NIY79651.1 CatB-related O-acetyltransferase [Celeribacter sp. HF31]